MSVESIGLIGVLTFLSLFLGVDLSLILDGNSIPSRLNHLALLDAIGHIRQPLGQRMTVIFGVLFVGAILLNFTKHTRTEVYLLRIGMGAIATYAALVFLGAISSDNRMVEVLLWLRAMAVLVSFWSFLHYAMNPKV